MMINRPTLLLNEEKCRRNINSMVLRAQSNGVVFRPHFKTHQSLEIGRWFMEAGVDRIAVSSLTMAKYFSQEWKDITVAFPVNILEIDTINDLALKVHLNILIESIDALIFLRDKLKCEVGIFIKIDVGKKRTGLQPSDTRTIDSLLSLSVSAERLRIMGFLGHAGQTYNCTSKDEIVRIHEHSRDLMVGLKNRYLDRYPNLGISLGDTPGCSVAEDFEGIDETRPGNFVFYDLMQNRIGSCSIDQIAVAMACPVVAIHKDRGEMVLYGGGIHFSLDRLENEAEGTVFGRMVEKQERGWGSIIPGMYLKGLSQEHGVVSVPPGEIAKYSPGDYVVILPVHACMTASCAESYLTLDSVRIEKFQ